MTRRMKGTMTGGHIAECSDAGPRWPAGEAGRVNAAGPPAINYPSARPPLTCHRFGLLRCLQRQDFILLPNNLMEYGGDTISRAGQGNRGQDPGSLEKSLGRGLERKADSLGS